MKWVARYQVGEHKFRTLHVNAANKQEAWRRADRLARDLERTERIRILNVELKGD